MLQQFDRVKVFSATMAKERELLGERVTDWLRASEAEVVDKKITQSSDREFHCVTITLFCKGGKADEKRVRTRPSRGR